MSDDSSWFSRTVQDAKATAGGYAGGVVDSAGKSVNSAGKGVGDTVNSYAKGAGDYVSDYGNGIKDWTGADAPRGQTKQNPVGVKDSTSGGKKVVTGNQKGASGKQSANNPLGLSK